MKFYYKDKLVRTSKTHEYRYAIVKRADIESDANKIKPFVCSKDMEGIESNLVPLIKELRMYEEVKKGTYKPPTRRGWTYYTAKQIEANAIERYGSLDAAIQKQKEFFEQWVVVELESK